MIKTVLHIVLLVLFVLCVFGRRWIPGVFYPKKEGMIIKKILYVVLFGLLVLCVCGRGWIPGIYYPEKSFGYNIAHREPPLTISVIEGDNSFENLFWVNTLTNKPYEVLRIKKMSYEWEENAGEFLKDDEGVEFKLRTRIADSSIYEWYYDDEGVEFKLMTKIADSSIDGWYRNGNRYMKFGKFNPEKLFKGKRIGDKFQFYLKVVYSFDNEPEYTQILEYNIKVYRGEYESSIGNLLFIPVFLVNLIFGTLPNWMIY